MLLNFRISNALNNSEILPGGLQSQIERSPNAQRTAGAFQVLHGRLKREKPNFTAPSSLHASIMRELRSAQTEHRPVAWLPAPRWVTVSSLSLIVLLVFCALSAKHFNPALNTDVQATSLANAGSMLQLGSAIVTEAPLAALSPISEEIDRLDRDLIATQQFLLATLP